LSYTWWLAAHFRGTDVYFERAKPQEDPEHKERIADFLEWLKGNQTKFLWVERDVPAAKKNGSWRSWQYDAPTKKQAGVQLLCLRDAVEFKIAFSDLITDGEEK
jgi:hypothetical protein